ncbi:MAG TPA: XRE family transcriptional regulator [Mizugakiibacter sp.]|nr:XRE family transcriptional regulator [Mizugakiibacter sp.]
MKELTQSLSASSDSLKPFETVIGNCANSTLTAPVEGEVIIFENFTQRQKTPEHFTSVQDLMVESERDDDRGEAIEEARRWVAGVVYGTEADTIRSLRLRKGWSQARLAAEMHTSQSHIARIERGTENVAINTCRRLATALAIDMNQLDIVLLRQEAIAQAKAQA